MRLLFNLDNRHWEDSAGRFVIGVAWLTKNMEPSQSHGARALWLCIGSSWHVHLDETRPMAGALPWEWVAPVSKLRGTGFRGLGTSGALELG